MTNIYIETYGCSLNFADSEQMAGLLKEAQFQIVNNIEEAYIVILNTCTVKGPTENAFFRRLEEIEHHWPYKLIIVAGCIAQTAPPRLKKYPLIGTKQIHKVVEVVEEALNENPVTNLDTQEMPPLNLPRIKKNPLVGIIPLARGCLGSCSYCKVKQARGNLKSYPPEEIKKEALKLLKEGVKELWITSQDNGSYGYDLNTNLPALLKELTNLPGDFKIRVGMMNPTHLKDFVDDLVEIYKHPKVFKFLHLPVQSGNNQILEQMNREYKAEEFTELVNKFRKEIPDLTLATDIIVGFPGETEEQYWDTLTLVRNIAPDIVNISKFWPRPKTSAAELKLLPTEVVKHRSKVLSDICSNIRKMGNEKWLDWEGTIIIDEKGKQEKQWIGRNAAYKQVVVEGEFKLGDQVTIKITKVTTLDLRGEIKG